MSNNIKFGPSTIPLELIPNDHDNQSSALKLLSELKNRGSKPNSVLDVGCGAGDGYLHLKNIFPEINWKGVDLYTSPEVDLRGKKVYGITAFDGISLPFANQSFDLIYCRQVLEHVFEPLPLFLEISRVSKLNSLFIGSVSQLEPYHSFSTYNWSPYMLNRFLSSAKFDLLYLRPGIDGITLISRSLASGALKSFSNRFFENESPLNQIISTAGRILHKKHSSINLVKLRITGHICFVATKGVNHG